MHILRRLTERLNRTKRRVSDEYLSWLEFANPGMLNRGNVWLMEHAVKSLPADAPVLEIGAFCGLSTNVISYLLRRHAKPNRMFSCDRWIFEGAAEGSTIGNGIAHPAYRDFVKSSFVRNVEFFSGASRPYAIEAFSDEFFDQWRARKTLTDVFGRTVTLGGPMSFCYIDGNHTCAFAKRDFTNTDEFLVTDGFVLFDDSYDGNRFGLTGLMRELEKDRRYELVARNPNYLFRKVR